MKFIALFLLIMKIAIGVPIEGISWGMTKDELKTNYKNLKRVSFNKREELYRVEEKVKFDTAIYDFLLYDGKLIQVKISNKYPRQNASLSQNLMDIIEEEYTFTNVETAYIKEDGKIKQVQEYSGVSNDRVSHLIIKVDIIEGKHINTFIFTDLDFYNE